MKRNDKRHKIDYFSPECTEILMEVGARILIESSVVLDCDNIKDPTWNTDGDYGLE